MDLRKLKKKIKDVLKKAHFKDANDLIDVSEGPVDGNVHVVIVSRKFDDLDPDEKDKLIWNIIEERLTPDEWGHITLIVGTSPEEIKAI